MRLKIMLMFCMPAACAMCGHALAGAAERRQRLLSEILGALRILRIELSGVLSPLDRALTQTNHPLFVLVSEELPCAACVSDAWLTVRSRECIRGHRADCLALQDLSALDKLFEQLGTSGCEEQKEAVHSCALVLEESFAEAKERAAQVGKLYTSLGFLAGLALAILMI